MLFWPLNMILKLVEHPLLVSQELSPCTLLDWSGQQCSQHVTFQVGYLITSLAIRSYHLRRDSPLSTLFAVTSLKFFHELPSLHLQHIQRSQVWSTPMEVCFLVCYLSVMRKCFSSYPVLAYYHSLVSCQSQTHPFSIRFMTGFLFCLLTTCRCRIHPSI